MSRPPWEEQAERWPTPFVRVPFDVEQSAVVIVDVQQYWTDPDGPVGSLLREHYPDKHAYFYGRLSEVVLPNLLRLLEHYRHLGRPVLHVVSGSTRPDGRDFLPHLQRRIASGRRASGDFNLLHIGSRWHASADQLTPDPGEHVLNKTTRSAFTSTGIDQLLRNLEISQLAVCGLATNGCVDLTARDATDRGYETYLIEDACVTYTEAAHVPVLETFHAVFGTVTDTSSVLASNREAPA